MSVLQKNPERAEGKFDDFERSFTRYMFALTLLKKNHTVLDIASGSGYGTFFLSKGVDKIYGLEKDEKSVCFAQQQFRGNNIEYLGGDGTDIHFQNNFFDAIISFETIEHIADYKKFLSEIKRIIKKDGFFLISTPNKTISSPCLVAPLHDYHIQEWTLSEFRNLLSEYFDIEEIYVQNFKWPGRIVFLRKIYAEFFQIFGQKILRRSLKLLHFIIFKLFKFNKKNTKIINRDTILNFYDNMLNADFNNYQKSIYYPKKLNEADKLFGIQIFLLKNKKK